MGSRALTNRLQVKASFCLTTWPLPSSKADSTIASEWMPTSCSQGNDLRLLRPHQRRRDGVVELRQGRIARLEVPSCDGAPEVRRWAPPRTIGHGLRAIKGWYNAKIPRKVSHHATRANRRRAKRGMYRPPDGKLRQGARHYPVLHRRMFLTKKIHAEFLALRCRASPVSAHLHLVFGIGAKSPLYAVCVARLLYAGACTPPKSVARRCVGVYPSISFVPESCRSRVSCTLKCSRDDAACLYAGTMLHAPAAP